MSQDTELILPGATLGVVGGGQLGRMFCSAAQAMGYRVWVLTNEADGPAASCADREFVIDYSEPSRADEFLEGVSAVTFETESLPIDLMHAAAQKVPVRPNVPFLYLSQNRVREKTGLQEAGLPVGPCTPVTGIDDLKRAVQELGTPSILKTAEGGYDGKGQIRISEQSDLVTVWQELNTDLAILETVIPFQCEISVVAARSVDGRIATYGPMLNDHANHILDISSCPAAVPDDTARQAVQIARTLAESFDVVGVFCVEFFVVEDGSVLINEIAPRPHNSGHLTIEGHATSQFQQQVRCLCGFPVGSDHLHGPTAMVNLLGDLWSGGTPHWQQALECHSVQLHLYGKAEARPGRKMGHLTAMADNIEQAIEIAKHARQRLCT